MDLKPFRKAFGTFLWVLLWEFARSASRALMKQAWMLVRKSGVQSVFRFFFLAFWVFFFLFSHQPPQTSFYGPHFIKIVKRSTMPSCIISASIYLKLTSASHHWFPALVNLQSGWVILYLFSSLPLLSSADTSSVQWSQQTTFWHFDTRTKCLTS